MKTKCNFYYYSLRDILKAKNFSTKTFGTETLKNIIDTCFSEFIYIPTAEGEKKSYYNETHTNNIWQLIYAKFENEFIFKSTKSESELNNKDYYQGMKEIFIRLEETYPKYKTLLDKYTQDNLDLFKPIKTSQTNDGTNKFNDTPQIDGGYEEDGFASNFTENHNEYITETDNQTIMSRIAEVDANYKNVLEEWASSFYDLFIESFNV